MHRKKEYEIFQEMNFVAFWHPLFWPVSEFFLKKILICINSFHK